MNAQQYRKVSEFIDALEKASKDTGVVLALGAGARLYVNDEPVSLTVTNGDPDTFYHYNIEGETR